MSSTWTNNLFLLLLSTSTCNVKMDVSRLDVPDVSRLDLHMEYSDGENYNFNSQAMGSQSGCSNNGSSYSTSTYGPYTPTSARSTPPRSNSLDFGSSFASSVDSYPFDITPPSSAVSAYFPLDMATGDGSEYFETGITATPSRNAVGYNGLASNCGGQMSLTPQTMDFYSFASDTCTPTMVPTSMQVIQSGAQPWDSWSMWGQTSNSPVDFHHRQTPMATRTFRSMDTVKQEDLTSPSNCSSTSGLRSEVSMSPTCYSALAARRRVSVEDASTALQRVQGDASPSLRPKLRAELRRTESYSSMVTDDGIQVKTIPSSKSKCDYPGCTARPFKRVEHMKRHKLS